MAEDNGDVLRRSLDAVDRSRKRLFAALAFVGLLLLVTAVYAVHSAGRNTVNSALAHYFMLLIWVTVLTLVVIVQITLMTKRILRAIELASRK